jgi:hypothetical protein
MILDENTTIFLIQVLNEDNKILAGGGGGVSTQGYQPYTEVVDPKTGKIKKIKNPESEDKFYTKVLQQELDADPSNTIDLEQESRSQPSLALLANIGTLKRRFGYDTNPSGGVAMKGENLVRDVASTLGGGGLAGAGLQFMGPLGQAVSQKLPYLAALGVDPFDYATKIMGVDYVGDQLKKLGARQAKQITAGQGYPTL